MGDSSISQDDIDNLLSGSFDDSMISPTDTDTNAGKNLLGGDPVFDGLDSLLGGDIGNARSTTTPSSKQSSRASSRSDNRSAELNSLGNLAVLKNVVIELNVELGKKERLIKDILALGEGSIIELDKSANDLVDILANNRLIARGEVVVVDEQFGVRITEMIDPFKLD